MFPNWLRRLTKSRFQRADLPRPKAWRRRFACLRLETLEGRLAPAVHTWTGHDQSQIKYWSVPANWVGGSTPAGDPSAVLIFDGPAQETGISTNDLTGLTIQSITFEPNNFSSAAMGGNAITLTGDITENSYTDTIGMDITLAGSTRITVAGGCQCSPQGLYISGVIRGASGFTKDGTGALTLSGANTYTGTTTLVAGTLEVDGPSGTLGIGPVVLDGGTLFPLVNLANTFTVGDISHQSVVATIQEGYGNVHLTGNGTVSQYGALQIKGGTAVNLYLDGNLSGSGAMRFGTMSFSEGAFVTVNGNNSGYSGAVTVPAGALVTVGRTGALGSGPLLLNGGLQSSAAVTLPNPFTVGGGEYSSAYIGGSQNLTLTGAGSLTGGNLLTVTNNGSIVSIGGLSGTGSLLRAGLGTLLLSAAATYSGDTTINGGILQLGAINALPATTNVSVAMAGTLDLHNQNAVIASLAGAGSVTLGTGTLTTGGSNSSTTFSGPISGAGGLTKAGTGTLTLSSTNTYTGATTVSGGKLLLGTASALASATAVSVAVGATLDLNSRNVAIGALAGGGTVALGTGTLTTGGANISTTFSGNISGTGGLTETGTGMLTLASANGFTGATTVNAGTLRLAADNAVAASASITVNASGTLNFNGGADIISSSQNLTGSGSVVFSGGTVTIRGTYSISGSATVTSGTAIINSSGTVRTLSVSGGSFQATGTVSVTNATLSGGELGGAGTVLVSNSGHLDWSGGTMDGNGMTMIAAGSQLNITGSGARFQTGRQVCNAGNVIWGGSGGIWWVGGSNANIRNENGGMFDFNAGTTARFGFTGGNASFTNDTGALFRRSNTGTTTFDANVTFSNAGTASVQSGTLTLGGGSSSTTFSVAAGATLNFGGGTFTANTISGAGQVVFSGGATTVQSYTVTGPTSVAGGAVTFSQAVSLANLAVSSGSLTTMATMTISQLFDWSGGALSGPGTKTVSTTARMNVRGSGDKALVGCSLSNQGTITWTDAGALALSNGATFVIQANALLDAQSDAAITWDGSVGAAFTNNGTFRKSGGGAGATVVNIPFANNGTLDLQTGTLSIPGQFTNFGGGTLSGGTYLIAGMLQFNQANIVTDAANLVLDGSGPGQILDLVGNNGLANLAVIDAAGMLTLQNGYVLTTGGDLVNFGYLLIDATSQLNVSGNYTQDAAATLEIQLDGIGGTSGQLNAAGAANLNGTLVLTPVNGYVPSTGDSFAILTYGTRNGTDFANPPAGFNESFDDGNGILTVIAQ